MKRVNVGTVNYLEQFDNFHELFEQSKNIKGISKYASFCFHKNSDGVVVQCFEEMIGEKKSDIEPNAVYKYIPIQFSGLRKVGSKIFDERKMNEYIKTLRNYPQIHQKEKTLSHFHEVLQKNKPSDYDLSRIIASLKNERFEVVNEENN